MISIPRLVPSDFFLLQLVAIVVVVCFAAAALLVSLKIALNFFALRMKPKPKPKILNQMPKRNDSQSVTTQVVECEFSVLRIPWNCKRNIKERFSILKIFTSSNLVTFLIGKVALKSFN